MTGQTAGSALDRTYTLNALGNVTTVTDNLDSGRTQGFTYDDLDRLDSETGSYAPISYSHDKNGNRLSMTESGSTAIYSYEATSNRLSQVDNNIRSYDLSGMTTSSENGKYKYSYNDGNRLESLTEKTGKMFFIIPIKDESDEVTGTVVNFLSKYNKTDYLYDGFGRRTESAFSSGNSGKYHYHYDQSGKLLGLSFYDSNGIHLSSKEFIWLDNLPVAQVDTIFNSSGAIESSNITWLHTDHLNTPLFATNAAGNVVWRWDRDAFGTIEPDADPDGDGVFVDIPLRFPGQIRIQGDGTLFYNMHRFYESGVGRYLTPDPIGLDGGINLFSYANQNPINFIDPRGLSSENPTQIGSSQLPKDECYCPGGEWTSFSHVSASLFFGGGGTIARTTYTCKSNGKQCVATAICFGGGPIAAAGLGVDFGGQSGAGKGTTKTYNKSDFGKFSSGAYVTGGPVSGTFTGSSSNAGVAKSYGLGGAYVTCTNVLLICDE